MNATVTRRRVMKAGIPAFAALVLLGTLAEAETWPSRPVKIVCAYPAGGLVDAFARVYGEYLSLRLGQPVLVENRAGASGSLAAQAVKMSPADGYTLLFAITATLTQNRVLYKDLGYDPDKDFVLISSMSAGHLPLVASKATGVTNLREFVEYARKNTVNVGTWGAGSFAHIVVAELNKEFGLEMKAVHYRGEAPMWRDLAAGVLQAGMGSYPNASNAVKSGAGSVIAVSMTRRHAKLPDVPTFVEQGVKSKVFSLAGYIGLVGPAGMPQEIVERLSALMVEAGKSERVQKLLGSYGIDDAAEGHIAFKRLHHSEAPVWVEAVRRLELVPQ